VVTYSYPSSSSGSKLSNAATATGWAAAMRNGGGSTRSLTVYVVCSD
jgi:hypothetical protein